MQRKYRLTSSLDFKRVRRFGKSYAHPLIVLIKHPNELEQSRFGVAAGRSIGNAVQRNRAKRQLREIIRTQIPNIQPGWDLIFLARQPINGANFQELITALNGLIQRSGIGKQNQNVN